MMSSKALLAFLSCVFGILAGYAGPFSPEWNFENFPAPRGNVRVIRENTSENTYKFVYDASGRLVSKTTYFDNKPISETKLAYDSRNRLVRIDFTRTGGQSGYVEKAEYNSDGLVKIVRDGIDINGKKYTHFTSSISLYPDGRVREIVMPTDPGKDPVVWRWDFDKSGHVAMVYTLLGKRNLGIGEYRCDEHGDILEARRYAPNGLPAGYLANTYKYDDRGNWIEKTTSFGRDPKDIVKTSRTTRAVQY